MTKKTLSSLLLSLGLLALVGCTMQAPEPTPAPAPGPAPSSPSAPEAPQSQTQPVSSPGFVRVENYSSTTIWYLYISPSASSDWGPDQLGSQVLSSNTAATYSVVDCNQNYDLQVEGEGHWPRLTRFGVFIPCGSGFTWQIFDA